MTLDTILIVDDEAAQRDALSDFFTNVTDYNVLTASSGEEAVELLKKRKEAGEKTKVIIMDIKMPGKNGLEASLDIKNTVDRNIPIIFNTAFPDEFKESILRDQFLFFAYQTKGDELDELSMKVERAVRHYNLMNETIEFSPDDFKSFTVKNCPMASVSKSSSEVIAEILESYRGRPDVYISNIANNVPYSEKVRFIDGSMNLPKMFEAADEKNPSRVVCYGSLNRHKQEIFESLIPGGQAIFVVGLPSMTKSDKMSLKQRLNEQGFIVEGMTDTADKKLIIEARKPIVIEDAHSGLILKEAQSDKEMRDYYFVTREYFDMLTREIDMTFDQISAHFVVYKKEGMVPLSTIRVVPKEKIRLPLEFGTLPDGSFYSMKEKSSAEISHLANLANEKAKGKGISFTTFGEALKMVFAAALKYCVANKIDTIALTYDESNPRLEKLYTKVGMDKVGTSIGYSGYPEKYAVMSMDIVKKVEMAVKNNDKLQVSILNSVLNDPVRAFILVHDSMFASVPAYRKMYDEVVSEIESRDDNLERKLVVDMPVTTGNLSRMLAEKYDIIGVDISKDALELAENKAKETNPNVKYSKIEANVMEGVPINNASADYVACINLLYSVREPEKVLSEIYRVLKPGGYAVITNFNSNVLLPENEFMKKISERFSPEESKDVKFWKDSNDLVNLSSDIIENSYFSKEMLEAKMREAGFEVEKVKETFLGNSYLAVGRKK